MSARNSYFVLLFCLAVDAGAAEIASRYHEWKLEAAIRRKGGPVISLAHYPFDPIVAVGGEDRTLTLLDLQKGEFGADSSLSSSIERLGIAQDGRTILADGNDGQVQKGIGAEFTDGEADCEFPESGLKGKWKNGSGICAIELEDRKLDERLLPFYPTVRSFFNRADLRASRKAHAFSNSGRWFAFVDKDAHGHLWDLTKRREVVLYGMDSVRITAFAFSPDDGLLAATESGPNVHLWDTKTGSSEGELKDATNDARALVFSPDGSRLIVGGDSEELFVYKRAKAVDSSAYRETSPILLDRRIRTKACKIKDDSEPTAGDLSADGTTAYWAGRDGIVRVVSVPECRITERRPMHKGQINWLRRSTGYILTRDNEDTLISRMSDGIVLRKVSNSEFTAIGIAEAAPVIAYIDKKGLIRVADIPTLKIRHTIPEISEPIVQDDVFPNGRVVKRVVGRKTVLPTSIGLSSNGDYLGVLFENKTYGVWSVAGGTWTTSGRFNEKIAREITVSSNGRLLATVGREGGLAYKNVAPKFVSDSLARAGSDGTDCFSPKILADNNLFVYGCKEGLRIVESTGYRGGVSLGLYSFRENRDGRASFISIAQNSSFIMSGDAAGAIVIERLSDESDLAVELSSGGVTTLSGLPAPITAISISSDNERVYAGLQDGSLFIWSIRARRLEAFILAHSSAIVGIAPPAGTRGFLVTTDAAGKSRSWYRAAGELNDFSLDERSSSEIFGQTSSSSDAQFAGDARPKVTTTSSARNPDGGYVATGWADGMLRIRGVPASFHSRDLAATGRAGQYESITTGTSQDLIVLIGISRYQEKSVKSAATAGDVGAFEALLRERLGWNEASVVRFEDEAATQASISKYLMTWLANHAVGQSRISIYFSGLGATDPETGARYFLPFDGDPSYLKETAVQVETLLDRLATLPSQDVRLIIDAGFAGGGARNAELTAIRPLRPNRGDWRIGRNTTLILADAGKGRAENTPDGTQGQLTSWLVSESKRTSGRDVSISDMATYLGALNDPRQRPAVLAGNEEDLVNRVWKRK